MKVGVWGGGAKEVGPPHLQQVPVARGEEDEGGWWLWSPSSVWWWWWWLPESSMVAIDGGGDVAVQVKGKRKN